MNYYKEIKNKIIENEIYSRVKDYSKERHKIITYFEIGKLLNETVAPMVRQLLGAIAYSYYHLKILIKYIII